MISRAISRLSFFFFNDTATTEIYPLSLHDALPIYVGAGDGVRLLEPLSYLEMLGLVSDAGLVITDSGGLQEETTWLGVPRSEEHTSELQSQSNLVCRLLLEKKKNKKKIR